MRKASDCHLKALLSARTPTLELRKKAPPCWRGLRRLQWRGGSVREEVFRAHIPNSGRWNWLHEPFGRA